ncbi:MAG TPA: DUF3592 domain-containing protein [Candidatus Limnocylindria bacterium]
MRLAWPSTVARRHWDVVRDGRTYRVDMEDEYFLGKRVVRVDGRVAYEGRQVLSDHSGTYEFDLGGAPAFLRISTPDMIRYRYELLAGDGVAPSDASSGAPDSRDLVQRYPTLLSSLGAIPMIAITIAVLALAGEGRLWKDPVLLVTGLDTQARVTSVQTPRGAHLLHYQFVTDSGAYAGAIYATDSEFALVQASGLVGIRYSRVWPAINGRRAGTGDLVFDLALLALFGFVAYTYAAAMVGGIQQAAVVRRLRDHGIETSARIAGVRTYRSAYMIVTGWALDYEYATIDGTHRGRSGILGKSALVTWPIGTNVRIRYDPERPDESVFVG